MGSDQSPIGDDRGNQGVGSGRGGQWHRRHGHSHGVVDPSIAATSRGLWALKWSFVGLTVTALVQVVVVAMLLWLLIIRLIAPRRVSEDGGGVGRQRGYQEGVRDRSGARCVSV